MANNPNTGTNQFGIAEQDQGGHAFLNTLTNSLASKGSAAQTAGGNATASGTGTLENLSNFFSNILGGGGNMQQALAPQNEQVISQYDAARKALATTGPRGGGTAEGNLKLATDPISAVNTNTATARTGAATQLGDLGSKLATLGVSEQAEGASSENAAGSIAGQRNYTDATTGFLSTFKNSLGAGLGKMLTSGFGIASGPSGTSVSALV